MTPTTSEPPTCGDGFLDEGELCDEAEKNSQASYTPNRTCLQGCSGYTQHCGDGQANGPEVCDDGEVNGDEYSEEKHCNRDCSGYAPHCGDSTCQSSEDQLSCAEDCMSVCGDGKVQAGEQCDEVVNTATCNADCTFPECGDGFVNPEFMNEECDDKDMDNTDECLETCQNARCGDGFLLAGVEGCDDGNQEDADTCSAECVPARRVFVTASTYGPTMIQGVAGADGLCQAAAMAVPGLGAPGNTWLAWLSDDTSSPSTRVPHADTSFAGYYLLPTGAPVAKGWAGLTSGTLMNPIHVTEAGLTPKDSLFAWTNTRTDGTSGGTNDCENWSMAPETDGGRGSINATSEQWTEATPLTCIGTLRLYCFEVSP